MIFFLLCGLGFEYRLRALSYECLDRYLLCASSCVFIEFVSLIWRSILSSALFFGCISGIL